MERATAKILMFLTYIVMSIAVLCSGGNGNVLAVIMVVGFIITLILSRFLRCPKCGRGQGRGWLFEEYCSYCGTHLDD